MSLSFWTRDYIFYSIALSKFFGKLGKDLRSVRIDRKREFAISDSEFLLPSIITKGLKEKESDILYSDAAFEYDEVDLKFIPYYAFANRGVCEMLIWVLS